MFVNSDLEKRRKWLGFLLPENKVWIALTASRWCSAHFISGKKSEDAGDPDFAPSVYPKIATIKQPGSSETANTQSVARYKCAKQRSANKEIAEQET